MDARIKSGHDIVERCVSDKRIGLKKEALKSQDSKPTTLRPIGLDAGKVIVHYSFFDPMPGGFMKAFE